MTQAMTTTPQRNLMHDRTRSAWLALTLAALTTVAGVVPAQTPDAKPAQSPAHAAAPSEPWAKIPDPAAA